MKPKSQLMENFLKDKRASFSVPRVGDMITGKVILSEPHQMFLDLGTFGTGIIYGREFYGALRTLRKIKPGDPLTAKIVDFDHPEGYVELSIEEAGKELTWDELKQKRESGEPIEIVVKNANKGGLIAEINNIQAFLPVSQLSSEHYPRVEGGDKMKIVQELRKLVGKVLTVKILDLSQSEGKIILSEKAAFPEDLDYITKHFSVGQVVSGEITGVVDFGAFVKFPAEVTEEQTKQLEGLIHISELDWKIITHPEEVVRVGDRIEAKIIDIQDGKISLSLKALKKDPWEDIDKKYKKGDVIKGVATKFNPYGAFAEIEPNIQGLVHISEFGSERKMTSELQLGNAYEFKILSLDPKEHRMSLGLLKKESEEEKKPE